MLNVISAYILVEKKCKIMDLEYVDILTGKFVVNLGS